MSFFSWRTKWLDASTVAHAHQLCSVSLTLWFCYALCFRFLNFWFFWFRDFHKQILRNYKVVFGVRLPLKLKTTCGGIWKLTNDWMNWILNLWSYIHNDVVLNWFSLDWTARHDYPPHPPTKIGMGVDKLFWKCFFFLLRFIVWKNDTFIIILHKIIGNTDKVLLPGKKSNIRSQRLIQFKKTNNNLIFMKILCLIILKIKWVPIESFN